MTTFTIEPAVFEQLPHYCVGLVLARGLDNSQPMEAIHQRLEQAVQDTHAYLEGKNIRELPNITAFRDAFETLGMNPNKFMCSIEALYKRVQKQATLPAINPVVDLGNAFSLRHQLPMGAHRLDRLTGSLDVRFSTSDDTFLPMGATEIEQLSDGELVYASGNTVKTRRWIWRQSDDGKITEDVTDVIFPIDGFNRDEVTAVCDELAAAVSELFGCEVHVGLVDAVQPVFEM